MRKRSLRIVALVCSLAILFSFTVGTISADQEALDASVELAVTYVGQQQQDDGGLAGFSGGSDVGTSALGLIALGLVDEEKLESGPNMQELLDYVTTNAVTYTHEAASTAPNNLFPGRAGQVLTALSMNASLTNDNHADLIAQLAEQLEAVLDPATGAYQTSAAEDWTTGAASASGQAWSILGLSALGRTVPLAATNWLIEQQASDGSFGDGDPDTTAVAGVALLLSGNLDASAPEIKAIVRYFQDTQLESAGWRPSWDEDPLNADTTGWAIQFLVMAGEDVDAVEWQNEASTVPSQALSGLQNEKGVIGGTYANLYSTIEALLGLVNRPLSFAMPTASEEDVPNSVGLVIEKSDGTIITQSVSFTENQISGLEVLERSGLELTYSISAQGAAVCSIDGDGCPSGDCFCDFPDRYWSYWQWVDGSWEYAPAGAVDVMVSAGDIQGWAYTLNAEPPSFSPDPQLYQQEGIVVVATALPETVTPVQTVTPELTASSTPESAAVPVETVSGKDPATEESNETAGYVVLAVLFAALSASFVLARRRRR